MPLAEQSPIEPPALTAISPELTGNAHTLLDAPPNSQSARDEAAALPFILLLARRDELLAAIDAAHHRKPVAKCRAAVRKVLAPVVGELLAPETEVGQLVRRAHFDEAGSPVWALICQLLCSQSPKALRAPLSAAFDAAQADLSPEQRQDAEARLKQRLMTKPPARLTPVQRKAQRAAIARLDAERAAKDVELKAAALEQARVVFFKSTKALFAKGSVSLARYHRVCADYKKLYFDTPILAQVVKDFGVTAENKAELKKALAEEKKVAAIAEKAAAKAQAATAAARAKVCAWEQSLVFSTDVPKHLAITPAEYKRWMAEGKLVPTLMREFYKWGKTLETPLFDPKVLAKITPTKIAKWRATEAAATKIKRVAASKVAAVKTKKTLAIKKSIALADFAQEFEAARSLGRTFELCLGPTNSGKTHKALEALIAAQSGVYLAPLRLLALEGYERLKAAGVAVSLMTGEERVITENATHVCATVEMCDFTAAVDVAVIDEVQMLSDSQRGWAWVSAILGVPAKTVFACGALYAGNAVQELLADTGEPFICHSFERLTPLTVEDSSIDLHQVQAGDAVIAFSRKDVLNFAALLKKRGLGVSVIYGALSPEVRRRQARAFIEGKNQVVVATDAIGMGLNLPIRRIVFSATQKYDGVSVRYLYPAEIQQIAGRAGRYGMHEAGFVTTFGSGDLQQVRHCLAVHVDAIEGAPFQVMPTWLHVQKILVPLASDDVREALELFQRIKFKGIFQQAELGDTLARLALVGFSGLPPRDAFTLATAPADPSNNEDAWLLRDFSRVLGRRLISAVPYDPLDLGETKPASAYLAEAEAYSRRLALYSWFACKYPENASSEGLAQTREALAEFIDACLLDHKKAFFEKRRKQYRWKEDRDFDDFDDFGED